MSISRVKPAGWALNEKLTSAQANALDTNIAKALDKTAAGDTIEGEVHVDNSAAIIVDSGGTLRIESGANGVVDGTMSVAGVLSIDGGGGQLNVAGDANISGTLRTTGGTGAIILGNGDYPQLAVGHAGRSQSKLFPFAELRGVEASGFNMSSSHSWWTITSLPGLVLIPLPRVQQGATLTSVQVIWRVTSSRSSYPTSSTGVPSLAIRRVPYIVGSPVSFEQSLSTTATQYYSPAPSSLSGWIDSANLKLLTFNCNQNNVLDPSQYAYFVELRDEAGTGAEAGNQYLAMKLNYTITELRPL